MTFRFRAVCGAVCATFAFSGGDSAAAAPGAPPPGSGNVDVPHHVRIIDGDSIDAVIGGNRVAVGLIGLRAPLVNTSCGRKAKDELGKLERLARARGGGARFVEDPALAYDERGRRMYHLEERAGKSLAREMVKGGWARTDNRGKDKDQLKGDEDDARRAGRGCVWGDRSAAAAPSSPPSSAPSAPVPLQAATSATSAGDRQTLDTSASRLALAEAAAAPPVPPGFSLDTVASGLGTPTAFAFLPDGRILIAQQNGVVRIVKDGKLQSAPFIDISSKVNNYWDRGLLGIVADANFATTASSTSCTPTRTTRRPTTRARPPA